jgi:hypothetical protein
LERSASARFERVLAPSERAAAVAALDSAGAKVTSWGSARTGKDFAQLALSANADLEAVRGAVNARIDEPALTILEIVPREPHRLDALLRALAGPGRPAGVVEATLGGEAICVELDERTTPLRLLADIVDVELASAPGRSIAPILPLGDASLTAFAAATLAAPEIDSSRLVETYVAPLLRGGA